MQVLVDQIYVEKEIEKIKLGFQETEGFSVYAVMSLFDREMRGCVSLGEFSRVCEDLMQPNSNVQVLRSDIT